MPTPKPSAQVPSTLADLKSLSVHEQGMFLLKRLAKRFPKPERFYKKNLALTYPQPDIYGIAVGFPSPEVPAVVQYLLEGPPWRELERCFYVVNASGDGWYEITEEGWEASKQNLQTHAPNRVFLDALALLHKDLQDFAHYFREQKGKDAVAAAFKRVENRLNEIRDSSKAAGISSVSGVGLPHRLYDSGDLKFPFPDLGAGNQQKRESYAQCLRNLLSSAIGWFRNAFDHEPYNLPDFSDAEVIEHLFVASYMLRLIDKCVAAPDSGPTAIKDQAGKQVLGPKKPPLTKSPLSLTPNLSWRREPVPGGGDDERYQVSAGVENDGEEAATDFLLVVEFPGGFQDGGGHMLQRGQPSRPGLSHFEITNTDEPVKLTRLYPRQKTRPDLISFHVAIFGRVKREHPEQLQEKITATVYSGHMKPKETAVSFAELRK